MTKREANACEARVQGRAGSDRVRVISSGDGLTFGVRVKWARSAQYIEYWSGDAFRADYPTRGVKPPSPKPKPPTMPAEDKAPEQAPIIPEPVAKPATPKRKATKKAAHKE